MKLLDLLKSRKQLAEELNQRRAAAALAERTVTLCDRAAVELPNMISELRKSVAETPVFSELCAPDDSLRNRQELTFHREADDAMSRLLEDLPQIRAHWEEKAKAAAA